MKESQQQEIIKRYLLGDLLDQPAADEIERRLMTDDTFAEEVSICEDELIDHYIRKRLNSTERAKFENHFLLSPEMKERVQFAQIFKDHLDEQKTAIEEQQKEKSYFNWLPKILRSPAPAMLVILLVCGSGLFSKFMERSVLLNQGLPVLIIPR
jgi:hypothetical protein